MVLYGIVWYCIVLYCNVCMYVYVYVCLHIYMFIYICLHIYMFSYLSLHTQIYIYICRQWSKYIDWLFWSSQLFLDLQGVLFAGRDGSKALSGGPGKWCQWIAMVIDLSYIKYLKTRMQIKISIMLALYNQPSWISQSTNFEMV